MTRINGARVALAIALAAAAAGCGGGGKEHKVGQPATVSYTDDTTKVKSTVELTPTSIEKKSIADLSAIDLEPSQKSSTPYFIKVRYKNVGAGPIKKDGYSVYSLNAIDDRDETVTSLSVIGGFPACSGEHPDRLAKGKAFDSCVVFLIPEGGEPLASLEWVDNSISGDQRVRWKP